MLQLAVLWVPVSSELALHVRRGEQQPECCEAAVQGDLAKLPPSLLWDVPPDLRKAIAAGVVVVTRDELADIAKRNRREQLLWVEEREGELRLLVKYKMRYNDLRRTFQKYYAQLSTRAGSEDLHIPGDDQDRMLDLSREIVEILENSRPVSIRQGRFLTQKDCSAAFEHTD